MNVAILRKDVLDYANQRNLVPHVESWMTYITTLYNDELHLIARPEIKSTNIVIKGRMTAHAMPITVCFQCQIAPREHSEQLAISPQIVSVITLVAAFSR